MKRLFDVVVASGAIVALSPLLALIAAAVRIDSPGPVLFRQRRVGRGFRTFTMLKFRTMAADVHGPDLTAAGDPRVTRVGRHLRRTKLDELPQLVNVVRGEMSIVGPRPEVPRYVDMFRADYAEVLTVRPGITGPASLAFRDEESLLAAADDPEALYVAELLPRKIALAREYAQRPTLGADLRIIARTLRALARPGRGR